MVVRLLQNAEAISDVGLFHGKMGISIFFYHLSRNTGKSKYKDYADKLIDEIGLGVTNNSKVSLDFEFGLAGIGCGIEYLIQNEFLEGEANDVLIDLDASLRRTIFGFPRHLGISNGLLGLGVYLLFRTQERDNDNLVSLRNLHLLILIIGEFDRRLKDVNSIIEEPKLGQSNCSIVSESPKIDGGTYIFDLLWDYPLLLCFFSELYCENLYDFKVKQILTRLIAPLEEEKVHPKLQANRMFLCVVLMRVKNQLGLRSERDNSELVSKCNKLISSLISSIDIEMLNSELDNYSAAGFRYGISGVFCICKSLLDMIEDTHHKELLNGVLDRIRSEKKFVNNKLSSYFFQSRQFGIMDGITGLLISKFG